MAGKFFKFFQRERAEQPVFIVSGLPRSGTSLMMMMLEAAGIEPLTDFERQADADNPKGYYELERVKKMKDGDLGWLDAAHGKVDKVISALLSFLPQNHSYKIIFMRRDMDEILASQQKMLVNRGETPKDISDEEMGGLFGKHLAKITEWLREQPNIQTLDIDYNLLLKDPAPQVEEIQRFLGRKLDTARMISVIDPKLYRQQRQGK